MDALHKQILSQFQLVGNPISCERYGFGHINETYLVITDASVRYILQILRFRREQMIQHCSPVLRYL